MSDLRSTDETVRSLFQTLLRAWSDGDAVAYGRCFTEDADYVSFDGTLAHGRGAIVGAHDSLFRGVLAGSALVGDVEDVRFLRADVAVVHATGSVLMPWRARLPKRRLSRQTLVAVDREGHWLWTSLHNTRVRPMRVPEPERWLHRQRTYSAESFPISDQRERRPRNLCDAARGCGAPPRTDRKRRCMTTAEEGQSGRQEGCRN